MPNKKLKLLVLLVVLWIIGLSVFLIGGKLLISLASYFLVGDFDFDRSDLIKGAEISIGCGIIIGVGQTLMSKEKSD
ncbi:hypothetical protein [Pantoea sp.]|uniref:hypothetical protein n=1 Tax=Pantoea sp. TaxID=69393 RepID=UPI0028ACA42B|nr:hypothetical protein [Pantoea sp.]